jgi:hypothetical protein
MKYCLLASILCLLPVGMFSLVWPLLLHPRFLRHQISDPLHPGLLFNVSVRR